MAHLISVHFREHIGKMRKDKGGGSEFRFPVLMYGIMGANPRGRFWHSQELIAEHLGTYKPRINEAIDWLIEAGAIRIVPRDKREDDETRPRGHVYEITGYINLDGERYRYLHFAKSHGTDSVPQPKGTESVPKEISGTDSADKGTDSVSLHYREEKKEENQILEDHHQESRARDAHPRTTRDPAPPPADEDEDLNKLIVHFRICFDKNETAADTKALRKFKTGYGFRPVWDTMDKAEGRNDIKHPIRWIRATLEKEYRTLEEKATSEQHSAELMAAIATPRSDSDLPPPAIDPEIETIQARLEDAGLSEPRIDRANGSGFLVRIPARDYDAAEALTLADDIVFQFLAMDDHILTYRLSFADPDESPEPKPTPQESPEIVEPDDAPASEQDGEDREVEAAGRITEAEVEAKLRAFGIPKISLIAEIATNQFSVTVKKQYSERLMIFSGVDGAKVRSVKKSSIGDKYYVSFPEPQPDGDQSGPEPQPEAVGKIWTPTEVKERLMARDDIHDPTVETTPDENVFRVEVMHRDGPQMALIRGTSRGHRARKGYKRYTLNCGEWSEEPQAQEQSNPVRETIPFDDLMTEVKPAEGGAS